VSGPDWRVTGERVEALIAAAAAGGALARERTEEVVRLVADLYGAGLERVLTIAHEHGALTDELIDALAADDLVSGLLLVHGLHPYDVRTRVEQALDGVRPYLGSHGGDVELIEVTADGVVRLRMLGSCDGCPSSSATLELAVEGAIEAAAPEVTAIEVAEPAAAPRTGAVIPVEALFARLGDSASPGSGAGAGSSWVDLPELAGLAAGTVTGVSVGALPLIACRVGADLYAFRDGCARCGGPLAGAPVARRLGGDAGDAVLSCPGCRAHYDVRRAGACLDDGALHLAPLPLLAEGGSVLVAVPAPVPT
jgi:Fe-S cluster biogenesis protein NfuA/nitrite reductase/ring-hydroxylating ferredoxin subunit